MTALYPILGSVIGILVVLSLIIAVLREWYSPDGRNDVIETINATIVVWWGMVVVFWLASLFDHTGVILLFLALSFAALREFLTLTTKKRADHYALLLAFVFVLPFQYYLLWIDWYGLYSIFIPVYAFLILPVVSVLRGATEDFLIRVAETQWALMICVFCASHVPALLLLDIPGFEGANVLLIVYLVAVVQINDLMHYLCAKLVGRRRVVPHIEASKTWEGVVGGFVSALLIGTLLWWITPFAPWQAFLVSLVLCVSGLGGHMVMTAIKRDRGVRDWGHLVPGHGGFVDRLDSVIFAAPLFFHTVRYFWAV